MLFADDLAIDLGTATTRVHCARRGELFDEPTVVARDRRTREAVAVGSTALEMVGRTPEAIEAVRPVRAGAISDFEAAEALLYCLIRATRNRISLTRPRVILSMPAEATQLEKRALREAVLTAGAGEVFLLPAPLAAAMGASEQVEQLAGHVIVDVGAGTTEVALLGHSGAVHQRTLPLGSGLLNEALAEYLKREHDLILGARSIEALKHDLAKGVRGRIELRGHSRVEGSPHSLEVDADELRVTFEAPLAGILAAIKSVVVEAPPELCADAANESVLLSGGGSLLRGFDRALEKTIFLPVVRVQDPRSAVVRGCCACLTQLDELKELALERPRPVAPLEACPF
jgi:rod shape-determining protein MreB